MAVEIEARGNVSCVYPATGKAFTINELINLLGTNISIYELAGRSRDDHDKAYYIVTTGKTREPGRDENEVATNIYAPFMKGLTDREVYGSVLVCTIDELESSHEGILAG